MRRAEWLRTWEALLAVLLVVVVALNLRLAPNYLSPNNLVDIFELSIEKVIVALIMTLIIINGEIDLSVASVMGLSASLVAYLYQNGTAIEVAMLAALVVGVICGLVNGFWVAYVGLPSLAVTLAGLIGYRGLARILLEQNSVGGFPQWFNDLGQRGFIGTVPLSVLLFFILLIVFTVILHYSAFGRYVFIIGNNKEAARFAGVRVRRVKMTLFVVSALIAALAGIFYAMRLGTVRADAAEGFELDIVTIVLLGGVSIFGGKGTMIGVGLSILLVLNIRNGMNLATLTGHIQTSVIGVLLILSVLVPNLAQDAQQFWRRRNAASRIPSMQGVKEERPGAIGD
ncbi:MAG: ABC transporter permease [Anaerolineae bacterium]